MADNNAPWPLRLTVSLNRETLTIAYDDGSEHTVPAEHLRVHTPSAERTGHGRRMVIGGKAGITIERIVPVGRYAVRIVFSDGHDTGLYTFNGLHGLGRDRDALWDAYEAELAATGLTRERPGTAPAPETVAEAG